MSHNVDLKVYLFSAIALTISMQNIELVLRITLLSLSILYTIYKIIDRFREKSIVKKKDDELL